MLGEETWSLQTYEDIFNCNEFLIKADPGMGKTTLGRKMARNWATGVFKKFSIAFFVALKFVKPGDTIEKVIMQQNPELEGLQISQPKLRALLNRFSDRCLLILDGLHEHGLGQNEDVLKIIKNQKLVDCRIVVSSRPHSVKEVEQHFPTIIRVEGFTKSEASKFVSKFFVKQKKVDQTKIDQILQFKPSDSRENFPVHKCPILLSFLCLLVREDKIDLLDKNFAIGDLYYQMVKCLYTKFILRKGIKFEKTMFHQVLMSVGNLALQTLKSGNPLIPMEDIVGTAGEFAFEYGLFAGHDDVKPSTDPTPGISVTYAHRSLEEFFWSFGFLQALNDGKSVEDILGSDCEEPLFIVNPLVFMFCIWLLSKDFFNCRKDVYNKLITYAAKHIDFHTQTFTDKIWHIYPAMNIEDAVANKDSLKLEFFKQIFEKCQHVRVFSVWIYQNPKRHLTFNDQLEGILRLISHSLLSKLAQLSVSYIYSYQPCVNSNDFTIYLGFFNPEHYHKVLKILLAKSNSLDRNPKVCTKIRYKKSLDLSTLIQKHIKELKLSPDSSHGSLRLTASSDFPLCPHFTRFTAMQCHIDNSVPLAFMKAVKNGKFPNLRRIELSDCTLNGRMFQSLL